MQRTYSACHCLACAGAEVRITARRQRCLRMLDGPSQDRLTHELVSKGKSKP